MAEPEMSGSLPPAMFIGGHLGLDFLNSIAVPVDEIVEWIGDGQGYLSWLVQAGLLSPEDSASVRAHMSAKDLNAVAADARTLREWFRGFVLSNRGYPLKPVVLEQLGPLIKILERDELFWSIRKSGSKASRGDKKKSGPTTLQILLQRRWRMPKSLLQPVAEELAKLVCSADFKWIKVCEGSKCTLLFLDLTRRRARRWCSMTVCGNRAKQAAHRERAQGGNR
jgi:predicted RNA-binding Zn ribbon-like protein